MIKKLLAVTSVLVFAAGAACAQGFTENFENGQGSWKNYGSSDPHPAIVTDQNTTPGGQYSLKTADNSSTNYTNGWDYNLAAQTGKSWVASWNFYDTGATREYVQLYCNDTAGKTAQLISYGVYNSAVDTTVYNFRVAYGSVNWTNTTVKRANNAWHAMKIEQIFNDTDSTSTLNFYIDGNKAGSANSTVAAGVSWLRLGSGLTNGGHGAYFDDISIATTPVPEPSSLLAMLTGVVGLAGVIRRKLA